MRRWGSAAVIILAVFTAVGGAAGQPEDELAPYNGWPITVEDAVRDFTSRVPAEAKAHVRDVEKEDLILLHFDWGMGIRNRYGLWRGNDKLIPCCVRPGLPS